MFRLPQSTDVKRPLPKAQLYKKFELKQSQRDAVDAVWQNRVVAIGEMEVADGNTLTEQIQADDERTKLLKRIESLERQMRTTPQKHCQREL